VVHSERIGGGPVDHAGLTKLKNLAGPSASNFTTPQIELDLTPRILQRAERCHRTRLAYPKYSLSLPGPVILLEIGPKILIGPSPDPHSRDAVANAARESSSAAA
jgi:hypothetical protein